MTGLQPIRVDPITDRNSEHVVEELVRDCLPPFVFMCLPRTARTRPRTIRGVPSKCIFNVFFAPFRCVFDDRPYIMFFGRNTPSRRGKTNAFSDRPRPVVVSPVVFLRKKKWDARIVLVENTISGTLFVGGGTTTRPEKMPGRGQGVWPHIETLNPGRVRRKMSWLNPPRTRFDLCHKAARG